MYSHASVLRMIEWRWDLEPLTLRDATAHNLAHELDFEQVADAAPVYTVPEVTGALCPAHPHPAPPTAAALRPRAARAHWARLGEVARRHGWSL